METPDFLEQSMPRYRSHKTVQALQIAEVIITPNSVVVSFADSTGTGAWALPREVISRRLPEPGDYLVRYADGYVSVSPRQAFEEGYTRIPENENV